MRSCHWGTGVFNQTSSPQLRPHGRSFATPTLQDFKEKKFYTDIIGFVMFVQHAETQRSRNISEILSETYKGNFGFWILLSFQGESGQGDPLECHWLRSIDILVIRSSLALQANTMSDPDPPWSTCVSLVCRSVRSPRSTTWTVMILSEATTEVMALDAQSAIRARSSWRTSRKRPSQIAVRSSTAYRARMAQAYAMPLPSRCCRAAW